ncbi:MAG: hypothetical protein ACRD26_25015 [Vicinamibacterales bacterium]
MDRQTNVDTSVHEACARLGDLLGLDRPVPEPVLRAVVGDDRYARYLMASRGAPDVLESLLANPPVPKATAVAPSLPGTATLIAEAASALLRWGRSGFGHVDDETYRRRLAACSSCEHLTEAPDTTLYNAVLAADDRRICRLCGCGVATKARLSSESCPVIEPGDTVTRWGEPRST